MSETPTSCGFVAIIGAPNAGKSTLVNALVGTKVSIVTQKGSDNALSCEGIAIQDAAQMVLVDTPGIFRPKKRLERAMVASAWGGANDADMIVMLIDAAAQLATRFPEDGVKIKPADFRAAEDVDTIIEGLTAAKAKAVLVLNKIDLLKRDQLLALADNLYKTGVFDEVMMISAHNGSGVQDLKTLLASRMPEGPWHYPEDQAADAPARLLAAEITREKLFLRVHEELPYSAAVVTTDFKDKPDGSVRIEQDILVERDGQRAIVLGKGGQTLKWIGQKSREELAVMFDRPVHLFLNVKVDEKWSDRKAIYSHFGLDFDS